MATYPNTPGSLAIASLALASSYTANRQGDGFHVPEPVPLAATAARTSPQLESAVAAGPIDTTLRLTVLITNLSMDWPKGPRELASAGPRQL